MDTRDDITKEQLETLVLVRCLEEVITDEHENLSSLSEVIWTLEESLSTEEHRQLVKDICILTEHKYLKSDATVEHIKMDKIPEVESITLKGVSALDKWEKEFKENYVAKNDKNITVNAVNVFIKNYSFMDNIKINISLFGKTDSVFSFLGGILRGIIKRFQV